MTARIALLLADVDGTLVTQDKVLTPAARDAVLALRAAGIRFAMTSGRPPRGMSMLIEPLEIDTPVAGFNGGAFVNPDLSIIDEKLVPADIVRQVLQTLPKHKLDCWLYTGKQWFVLHKDAPHVAREAWTVKFEPTVVDSFTDAQLAEAVKLVGVSDDHAAVEAGEAELQKALGRTASVARSQPYYLDITNPEANKGAVVRELCRRLDVSADQVATIGDMPNDVEMFRVGGFSIAMGNASDQVKQQASTVTDSNEQDGFAKAVHRHILGAT